MQLLGIAAVLASGLTAQIAAAHAPANLIDLIGMRGAFIEREMGNRGYTLSLAKGAQYFWNASQHVCVAVSTSQGRVAAINSVPATGCGQRPPAAHLPGHSANLGGLAGMNSIAAIDAMASRGFRNVDSFTTGNTQYGIYFNPGSGTCAQLTMADGRVVSANDIHTHPKCH